MIVEQLLYMFLGIADVLLSPLPMASELGFGPVQPVFEALGRLNTALPVVEALAAFSIYLTVVGWVFLFRLIVLVRNFLPFV